MPSLERFFNPQMRVFDLNVKSLPGARLYFFSAGTTTPKVTYADKAGTTPNTNPVIADASGSFPQIFLDALYRVELRSSTNIVQPGWPIDNVGQDTPIVPYANWRETVTYDQFERVTDPLTGITYRSKQNNNLGHEPADSPTWWEILVDPVADSFTSNSDAFSWSDAGNEISLNVDIDELSDEISESIAGTGGELAYFSSANKTQWSQAGATIWNFVNLAFYNCGDVVFFNGRISMIAGGASIVTGFNLPAQQRPIVEQQFGSFAGIGLGQASITIKVNGDIDVIRAVATSAGIHYFSGSYRRV